MFAFEVIATLLCGTSGVALILWWAMDRPGATATEPVTAMSSGPGLCPETVLPTWPQEGSP